MNITLIEKGTAPVYKTEGAVGADCYARTSKFIWLKPCLIPLGFAIQIPEGFEGSIQGRSGMTKKGLFVEHGEIDTDYRGEVSAITWSLFPKKIKAGERIAQLVIRPVNVTSFNIVKKLTSTKRGEKGFGSTGKI